MEDKSDPVEDTPILGGINSKSEKKGKFNGIIMTLLVLISCVLFLLTVLFLILFAGYFQRSRSLELEVNDLSKRILSPTCIVEDFEDVYLELTSDEYQAKMHKEIRKNVVDKWNPKGEKSILYFIGKIDDLPILGSRTNSIQNKNFLYVSGVFESSYRIMINLETGVTTIFAYKMSNHDLVWNFLYQPTLDDLKEKYGVEEVVWNNKTSLQHYVQNVNPEKIYVEKGVTLDFDIPPTTEIVSTVLTTHMHNLRTIKTDMELEMLRYTTNISSYVFMELMKEAKHAEYEFQIAGSFMNLAIDCGCFDTGFPTISGSGRDSSILHYEIDVNPIDHDRDNLLVDAGAGFFGYSADITRTFPTQKDGKFLEKQRVLYTMVLNVQEKMIKEYVKDAVYTDLQIQSQTYILDELVNNEFLDGDVSEMYLAGVHNIFYPHGLGHSQGLDVHDPGDVSIFKKGMVITCEPGIYFIENNINSAKPEQKAYMNMEKIQEYIEVGGVRIEDDILITESGNEVLTKLAPKTVEEIESVTSGNSK